MGVRDGFIWQRSARRRGGIALAGLLALAAAGRADSGRLDGGPSVAIVGVRDGQVVWRDASGKEASRELAKVNIVELEGQALFNQAEQAFAQGKAKGAAKLYGDALKRINDRDLQALAKARAIRALAEAGEFDKAVGYFWELYAAAPSEGTFGLRPQKLPEAGSKLLVEAGAFLASKQADAGLRTPESVRRIKLFLLEIYEQAGDPKAGELARELAGLGAATQAGGGKADAASVPAEVMEAVEKAWRQKAYEQTVALADAALKTARGQEAIRLYTLKARGYAGVGKRDEAVGAYLRIATEYPQEELQAAESLYQAAALLEEGQKPEEARRLYQEIVEKYPHSTRAAGARAKVE